MSLADQITQIRKLAAQGKTESEIAATVGVEMGDVATVLAGTAAGGPSSSSLRRTIACPFAYNTPGLLTGAALYTPTVGDVLHDAWIETDTAWDGTTPKGDVGRFLDGYHTGWWAGLGQPVSMLSPDATEDLLDYGMLTQHVAATGATPSLLSLQPLRSEITNNFVGRVVPAKFVTADPVKVVVSQSGANNGGDPSSTQGAAVLYLDISTPQSA